MFGKVSVELGAGRKQKTDQIDLRVGMVFAKKTGDKVSIGDVLAYIHANDEGKAEEAMKELKTAYKIGNKIIKKKSVVGIM